MSASFCKKRRYQINDVLGHGGFSTVYRATDRLTSRDVAIKVSERNKDNPAEHEAAISRDLSHPHVIRLLDSFKTRKHHYLVYELLAGKELFDHIVERDHFSEDDARIATRALLSSVSYLHSRNLVHRDIKPENILFRSTHGAPDDFVLADFGLAARVTEDPAHHVRGHAGSPGYCPPEMLDGRGSGRAGDIWSAGLVIYAMLSGRTPFTATDPYELQEEQRRAHIVYPQRYWRDISPAAKDFVQRCLTKDTNARMTAEEALAHPWLASPLTSSSSTASLASTIFERSTSQSSDATSIDSVDVVAKQDEAPAWRAME